MADVELLLLLLLTFSPCNVDEFYDCNVDVLVDYEEESDKTDCGVECVECACY